MAHLVNLMLPKRARLDETGFLLRFHDTQGINKMKLARRIRTFWSSKLQKKLDNSFMGTDLLAWELAIDKLVERRMPKRSKA
jgi:hypothetical protein